MAGSRTRRGFVFEYVAPDEWEEWREGSRYIYHGPDGEELIVSGFAAKGGGSQAASALMRERLLDNATRAMRNAASHPDLAIAKDLALDQGACDEECWTMLSETKDGLTLFGQAAVVVDLGALLVTFEAPKSVEAIQTFRSFLKSVRHLSES